MASISGQLAPLTIKITQLPDAIEIENGWRSFTVDVGSVIVSVSVRPRIWHNWVEGSQRYEQWIAVITGRMGELTDVGFVSKTEAASQVAIPIAIPRHSIAPPEFRGQGVKMLRL